MGRHVHGDDVASGTRKQMASKDTLDKGYPYKPPSVLSIKKNIITLRFFQIFNLLLTRHKMESVEEEQGYTFRGPDVSKGGIKKEELLETLKYYEDKGLSDELRILPEVNECYMKLGIKPDNEEVMGAIKKLEEMGMSLEDAFKSNWEDNIDVVHNATETGGFHYDVTNVRFDADKSKSDYQFFWDALDLDLKYTIFLEGADPEVKRRWSKIWKKYDYHQKELNKSSRILKDVMDEAITDFFYTHCDKQKLIDELQSITGEQDEEKMQRFLRIWGARGSLQDAGLKPRPELMKLWLRDYMPKEKSLLGQLAQEQLKLEFAREQARANNT